MPSTMPKPESEADQFTRGPSDLVRLVGTGDAHPRDDRLTIVDAAPTRLAIREM